MNDLINRVAERAGINSDQARAAVETVVAHIKDKLPPQIAGHVDGLLASGGEAPSLGDALKHLRGTMGS